MKLYVFDTDIAGFVQEEYPKVIARIDALDDEDTFATTIVTFGEDLSGWLPACRRALDGAARAQAYKRLLEGLDFYREMVVIPFDEVAARIFDQLKAQKIRIGSNDLAIAAITLSVNGILVTRNAVDFARVPNLVFEDWTR
ncbi:MAG TPA: type II toxin-antitoxin system VapC family toxin [Blastocatellia bacterium]|nr:type II toxin-antitoxin system VapC family toxin [Blastocatellia bacterium]